MYHIDIDIHLFHKVVPRTNSSWSLWWLKMSNIFGLFVWENVPTVSRAIKIHLFTKIDVTNWRKLYDLINCTKMSNAYTTDSSQKCYL